MADTPDTPIPTRSRRYRLRGLVALLGVWAILLQSAVAAFHHHDLAPAGITLTAAGGSPSAPTGGDAGDGHDCAVCQLLHLLQAITPPPGAPLGLIPVALAARLRPAPARRRHSRRRPSKSQPRAPPADV